MEIYQAMTSGVDLHFEVVLPWSVWHSARKTMRLECTQCIWVMRYCFAVDLNGLNLGTGYLRKTKLVDVMYRQDLVLAECFTSHMKGILDLWKSNWG